MVQIGWLPVSLDNVLYRISVGRNNMFEKMTYFNVAAMHGSTASL